MAAGISESLIPSTSESPAPLDGPSEGIVKGGVFVYVQEGSHEGGHQCKPCFLVCPNGH